MLGANLVSGGVSALFAVEAAPAVDSSNLGQYLPYAVGGGIAVVVILAGVLLSRRKATDEPSATDGSLDSQPPAIYTAPNPLWRLVIPGIVMLGLGVWVIFFVIPLARDVSKAREGARESIKAQHEETIKTITNNYNTLQTSPALRIDPAHQYQVPKIDIPKVTMPLPRPVYVDHKGIIRSR